MDATLLLDQLRRQGAEAEVFTGSADQLEVRFTAGEIKGAGAREASGLGVRAIQDGRLAFTPSRDTSPEGLERLLTNVKNALEVADASSFPFPGPADAPAAASALRPYDEATAALTVQDLVAIGKEALATLRERHPGVSFDAGVRRSVGTTRLLNSNGFEHEERHSVFSIGIEANRTRDEDVLLDYQSEVAISRSDADPQKLVDQLSQRLSWAAETVELRPGRLPVLFTPRGSLLAWSPLLQGLSGRTVMLGTSPLRERVGDAVLDPRLQLTDDGLLPGGLGSAPFDDEGLPRQRRALFADGVLQGFVHDLETAQATGQSPTANGERGGATGKPSAGFSNVVVAGGPTPQAELLKGISYGLLVHSVIGMGQGNTLPGTFSNPVDLAFLIEDGEVKGRVKDVSIAGNVYELLKDQVGGLSAEVERVGGSYFLPWLLLDGMNVVGKGSSAG